MKGNAGVVRESGRWVTWAGEERHRRRRERVEAESAAGCSGACMAVVQELMHCSGVLRGMSYWGLCDCYNAGAATQEGSLGVCWVKSPGIRPSAHTMRHCAGMHLSQDHRWCLQHSLSSYHDMRRGCRADGVEAGRLVKGAVSTVGKVWVGCLTAERRLVGCM